MDRARSPESHDPLLFVFAPQEVTMGVISEGANLAPRSYRWSKMTLTLPTEPLAMGHMLKSQPQTVLLVPVGTAQFQLTAFLQL